LEAVKSNPHNASVYGVKKPCVFSDALTDFDVTQRFPHDPMHDLLEGVLPLTTRLILEHFVKSKQCTLAQINASLRSVTVTYACNRPTELTSSSLSSRVTGSAAQKLELFLMLPRVLSSIVTLTCDSSVWCCYLYLREICDIVLAPVVDASMFTFLEDLICTFLKLYVEAFGQEKVIPKHHYMIHYPRHLRMFGPLRHMWCMRFEGKHQYFKNVAVSLKSFKNITKTLAKRHQMRQAWEMSASNVLISNSKPVKSMPLTFSSLPCELQDLVQNVLSINIASDEVLASVASHWWNGCCCEVAGVYVLAVAEAEHVPVFLFIKKIVCVRDTWLLCGSLLVPVAFESVQHAYVVHTDCEWIVVRPGELIDHMKHDVFNVDGQQFISLRYAVCYSNQ